MKRIDILSHREVENKVMEVMEQRFSQLPPPPKGCYYTVDNPEFRFDYENRTWEVTFDVVLKDANEVQDATHRK